MHRPDFVSEEDILRWSNNIDNDPHFPQSLKQIEAVREVCYAGLWLTEKLDLLGCPSSIIVRLQFTAGQLSFGRDTWEVSQELIRKYQDNELEFEEDPEATLN